MRDLVKALARGAALVAAAPALASYFLRAPILGENRALEGSTQALALVPGLAGQYLRRAFLSVVLAHCAPTVTVAFGTLFSRRSARLDDQVYVGPGCHLGWVHLERDVLLAAGVHIPSGPDTHGIDDPDRPIRDQPGTPRMVRVGAGSWIGSHAVILADVGANTVIAAGSVVTRPIPDDVIAAGVPAQVIRSRRPRSS